MLLAGVWGVTLYPVEILPDPAIIGFVGFPRDMIIVVDRMIHNFQEGRYGLNCIFLSYPSHVATPITFRLRHAVWQ